MSTFAYFGETLRFVAAEDFPAFAEAEFWEAAEENASSRRALGVALRLATGCVHADDREKFRALSRQHNAKMTDFMAIYQDWTAAEAERPTGLPVDSSAGPEVIPESSGSQPVASVTPIGQAPEPRGDLALAVARERRSA